MNLQSLEELIALAQLDLDKFIARHSGCPKNDQHIKQAKNTISGAKKLLDELKKVS